MTTNKAVLWARIPQELADRIDRQMVLERRTSKSEMVRILIEDGLDARYLSAEIEAKYLTPER